MKQYHLPANTNLGGLCDMNSNKKSIIIKCEEVEGVKTQFGSEVKMLMHPALRDLNRDVSVLWVTLPPGASTGLHSHPDQAEFEYIVSGKGVLEAGEDKIQVEPNMLVFNPPGLDHNVSNTRKATMCLLRFHVPSLPKGDVNEDLIGRCIEAAKRLSRI
jgi:mannose-6-phosphate isomerase-like protein (cupin superfamily)